jgi:oligopeptide/dipeptide ABC transporter ATP-binding protein
MSAVVEARDLVIEYATDRGPIRALDGTDLAVQAAESIGIVGESGSGKTTLGLAIGRLLAPKARVVSGELIVLGQSIGETADDELRELRRTRLGFIFQNPMAALDPTMTVGRQLRLVLSDGSTGGMSVREHLSRVGLREPERTAASYPHQLSGGMAQRAAIALALVHDPAVIVADEPTASLDSTIRGEVLDLLFGLARDRGASLLFLSHDLRSIAKHCDRVAVMYGGRVAELGADERVFRAPTHPYTEALLESRPGGEGFGGTIKTIPGLPPVLRGPSPGCAFAPRCSWVIPRCWDERPETQRVDERHVLCHRAAEVFASNASNVSTMESAAAMDEAPVEDATRG